MTETFTSFWLLLAFWGLVRYWAQSQNCWLWLSGIALGLGALVRPILLPLLFIWGVLILLLEITWRPHFRISRAAFGKAAQLLLAGLLCILPWQARNLVVHDRFILSDIGRATFENWIIARSIGDFYNVSRDDAVKMVDSSPNPQTYRIQFIKDHPVFFAKTQLRGIANVFLSTSHTAWAEMLTGQPVESSGIVSNLTFNIPKLVAQLQNGNQWIVLGIFTVLINFCLYIACVVSTVSILRRDRSGIAFKIVILALLTITYMMFTPLAQGSGRFRVPVEPILALLAGLIFYKMPVTEKEN